MIVYGIGCWIHWNWNSWIERKANNTVISHPASSMVKGLHGQNLPADVTQVIDQLERHCLAPDGSLISKPLYNDFQLVILSCFTWFFGVCANSEKKAILVLRFYSQFELFWAQLCRKWRRMEKWLLDVI